MKFIISQEQLFNSLSIMEQAINSKTVIDVLKGIKITAKNEKIEFLSSKADLALDYNIKCEEITQEGSVIVYGTQFINIIKNLRNEEKTLLLYKQDNLLIVETKNSKIKLVTLPNEDYPDTYFSSNSKLVTINKKFLNSAYAKAKYSVANNPSKITLTGINIDFTKENCQISSTDSRRLSLIKMDAIPDYNNSLNIGKNVFGDIVKVLSIIEETDIRLSQDNTQLYIETDSLKLKARVLDGNFPNVFALIPNNINFSFIIDSEIILGALSMMRAMSEKNNNVVTLEYINNDLYIKFFAQEFGAIEEKIIVENLEGSPFKIAFDPLFIIDSLHSLASDKVKFSFEAETSAFKLEDPLNDNNIQVVSPIRIS